MADNSKNYQRACPSCGGDLKSYRREWLFRCDQCGLLNSNLLPCIPTQPENSIIDETERAVGLDSIRPVNNVEILRQAEALFADKKTLSILDVGCGQGQFILDATSRGHIVTGIEPDANVAPVVRQRTGAELHKGFFPDALPENTFFDVVIFNDVLEHIPDAAAAIAACQRHLKEEGMVVVNCPNQEGVIYRIGDFLDRIGISAPFNRLWQKGLPSPHVWYFSPDQIKELGRRHQLHEVSRLSLLPITRKGLRSRIFHVEGQSKTLGVMAYLGASLGLPLLKFLPRDITVVFLRRTN